ncbi:MAG: HD-GYP domain-containing protein [Chloroflexi bacterium]|nr:HD-GYP domain-containing protein [Chloroflexota bacterium]
MFSSEDAVSHPGVSAVESLLDERPRRRATVNVEHVLTVLSRAGESMGTPGGGHVEHVAAYALLLAQGLDMSFQARTLLRRAALLHDIGKLGIDESILLKKGPLGPAEWEQVMLHPSIGERICRPLRVEKSILDTIRHHHERYDGTGYPDGLKGQEIPLFARIVALADAYDAMTSSRPYRKALSPADALRVVTKEAGKQFDPVLASTFCELMDRR